MTGDCEYILRVRPKHIVSHKVTRLGELQVKCTLTGRTCLLDGVSRDLCTRRTFALAYETRRGIGN